MTIMCSSLVESARHEKRSEKNVGRYLSYFGIGHRVLYGINLNLWFQTKTSINHFKMNMIPKKSQIIISRRWTSRVVDWCCPPGTTDLRGVWGGLNRWTSSTLALGSLTRREGRGREDDIFSSPTPLILRSTSPAGRTVLCICDPKQLRGKFDSWGIKKGHKSEPCK